MREGLGLLRDAEVPSIRRIDYPKSTLETLHQQSDRRDEAPLDVWPDTREQRCWVHRIANVLDTLPKRLHARAKMAPVTLVLQERAAFQRRCAMALVRLVISGIV